MGPFAYIYKSEVHYIGINCTLILRGEKTSSVAEWRVVSTHQYSRFHAGIICLQRGGHKGGEKRNIRHPGDVGSWCGAGAGDEMCVFVCV